MSSIFDFPLCQSRSELFWTATETHQGVEKDFQMCHYKDSLALIV